MVDVLLPGINGIDLVKQLQERYPGLLCLALSEHGKTIYIQHAFSVGARGYILKGNLPELREAIEAVVGGGTYLSPTLQANLSTAEG